MAVKYKGYTIIVEQDENPDDPRNWDNLGTMVCSHRRYCLGDVQTPSVLDWMVDALAGHVNTDTQRWENWCDFSEENHLAIVRKFTEKYLWLPLYGYDHSGFWMSTHNSGWPFNCPWDSGQVGIICVEKAKVLKEFDYKILAIALKKRIYTYLQGEVQTYSEYLSGATYYYKIEDSHGEIVDQCGGYYGSDDRESGLLEAAEGVIDYLIRAHHDKHLAYLKRVIRSGVPFLYRRPFNTTTA